MENTKGIFSNLQDTVTGVLNDVGAQIIKNLELKQFMKDLAASIRSAANAFLALPEGMQSFIIKGGLILALIAPIIIAFGQLILAIGWSIQGFVMLKGAIIAVALFSKGTLVPALMTSIAVIKAMGLALLTTPVGWFIAATAAIAGAAFTIWKNWDKFKTIMLVII